MVRPEILNPLFADIGTIKGVGPKIKQSLKKLAGARVLDLLMHTPFTVVDRTKMLPINQMEPGKVATAVVEVDAYQAPLQRRGRSAPFKVICSNESGFLTVVFFNGYRDYIKKQLPIGSKRVVSGKVERYGKIIQMAHPDYIQPIKDLQAVQRLEPIYRLTQGVTQRSIQKVVEQCVQLLPPLPEWIDAAFKTQQKWPDWHEAMALLHAPETGEMLSLQSPVRRRLAYDELLAYQVALAQSRRSQKCAAGKVMAATGMLTEKLKTVLPFELTEGQQETIAAIAEDLIVPHRMMRLLQGDVGSGKTVVSLFAMLQAAESGYQSAFMAPTEILAQQHYQWVSGVTKDLDVTVALLTASVKGKDRKAILEGLINGDIDIVIGTHALFQDQVTFGKLGFICIDEQHRFGVAQRQALSDKGEHVDILLMSATPIPRTLTMTLYGDMDCSRLTEKPAGRKPIATSVMPMSKMTKVVEGLQRKLQQGEKVYWICPLIEESDVSELTAVEERFKGLKRAFPGKVAMVHGRIKADEREQIMQSFKHGEIDILVATTVVEVGVDVKDATVIVIEHAERFGLSQLHQLRGRVGRGDAASSCVLLYKHVNDIGRKRLGAMRESNDGFFLAEEDLRLRGAGDVLGTRQSGLPEFIFANLYEHYDLIKTANKDAELLLQNDPDLQSPRGQAMQHNLCLFGYA